MPTRLGLFAYKLTGTKNLYLPLFSLHALLELRKNYYLLQKETEIHYISSDLFLLSRGWFLPASHLRNFMHNFTIYRLIAHLFFAEISSRL
jgi:hypothetical protein